MVNILEKYGIKEVCDFTFYHINEETGKPDYPVLFLDTLKVSTVEQTADQVQAKGGKGNATLLEWDTNKEITVTLEDALFSAKSLAIMFADGAVAVHESNATDSANYLIMRTHTFTAAASSASGAPASTVVINGKEYQKVNAKYFTADGTAVEAENLQKDVEYFETYDVNASSACIDINADSFPGTYYCVGDTYVRSQKTGADKFFQFVIPKAKVQSSNTITLEADGDPSTFSMDLKVLRGEDGAMMRLIQYDPVGTDAADVGSAPYVHNHILNPANE